VSQSNSDTKITYTSDSYPNFAFDITHRDPKSRARLGVLKTPHGDIETPNFIFCGTKANVKGATSAQVKEAGAQIILANTYHLMLQPGADIVERIGGLHKFMGWDGPMLTDSGGYQVFAMGHGSVAEEIKGNRAHANTQKSLLKITEEGAAFRSYIDGKKFMLTPEGSIDIQRKLGADLIVQFDEFSPYHVTKDYTARSMALSCRWGDRSLKQFFKHHEGRQAVYSVVQGGVHEDLRIESAQWTADRDFFGTAIGGSMGKGQDEFYALVDWCMDHVHPHRPVHLLGIGDFDDIFMNVRKGIDTFDCVSPTRLARHGSALVKGAPGGKINIKNARFRELNEPIDPTANNAVSHLSCAYIHHLFKAKEMLGMQLLTLHNMETMTRLMREIREAIKNGTLNALEKEWVVA